MALLRPLDLKFVRDHLLIHLSWSPVPNAAEYLVDITFETTLEHQSYTVAAKSLTIIALKYERCTAQVTAINGMRQSEPSFILTIEPLSKLFGFISSDVMPLDVDFSIECGPKPGYVTLKWSNIPLSCQCKIQRTDMNCTSIDNECITIIGKNQTSIYEDRTKCDSADLCCMGHYYTVSILDVSCQILTTILNKKVFCISSGMVKEVIPSQTTVSSELPAMSVTDSSTTMFCQVKSWLTYFYSFL
jgi:hypothetical protein